MDSSIRRLGPIALFSHADTVITLSPLLVWIAVVLWSDRGINSLVESAWIVIPIAFFIHVFLLPGFIAGWAALSDGIQRDHDVFARRAAFLTSVGSVVVTSALIWLAV